MALKMILVVVSEHVGGETNNFRSLNAAQSHVDVDHQKALFSMYLWAVELVMFIMELFYMFLPHLIPVSTAMSPKRSVIFKTQFPKIIQFLLLVFLLFLSARRCESRQLNAISWTWLSGSSTVNQNGACGAVGQYSSSFSPGGRQISKRKIMDTSDSNGISYQVESAGYATVGTQECAWESTGLPAYKYKFEFWFGLIFASTLPLQKKKTMLMLLSIILIVCPYASAQTLSTLYIDPAKTDNSTCGSYHCPCKTVAYAISTRSTSSVTLWLYDGSYSDNSIQISGNRNIRIAGISQNRNGVVFDLKNTYNAFSVSSGAKLTLENMTIANGKTTTQGGGFYCTGSGTQINLKWLVVKGGRSVNDKTSGGVLVQGGAKLVIENCMFQNNKIPSGSGSGGAIFAYQSGTEVEIYDSTFVDNMAGRGGAILSREGAKLSIWRSTFERNSATSFAGAIEIGGSVAFAVYHTFFKANTCVNGGAALCSYGSSPASVLIEDCQFEENVASPSAYGGAIETGSGGETWTIRRSYFLNNRVISSGGGAGHFSSNALEIYDTVFESNIAATGEGGALHMSYNPPNLGATYEIHNSTFIRNEALYGGGVKTTKPVILNYPTWCQNKAATSGDDTYGPGSIVINSPTFECSSCIPSTQCGNRCQYECSIGCVDKQCSPYTCGCECRDGFGGSNCVKCLQDRYGTNCTQTCPAACIPQDPGVRICDVVAGTCICTPNYVSVAAVCDQCAPGYWGTNCTHECSVGCTNRTNCDIYDGKCDCRSGWGGDRCQYQLDLYPVAWRWLTGTSIGNQNAQCGSAGQYSFSYAPGARRYSAVAECVDNTFYLFGGSGYGTTRGPGNLGDMWAYRQLEWCGKGEWAWLAGKSNSIDYIGNYSSAFPFPCSRYGSVLWAETGKLYVFGGQGNDAPASQKDFSDLWLFSIVSMTWEWLHGPSAGDSSAVFGERGLSAPSNNPGGVKFHVKLDYDGDSSLIFGGWGYAIRNGLLADIWKYESKRNMWAWLNGPSARNKNSIGGISGDFQDQYHPGGRGESVAIHSVHTANIMYLFGGLGYPSTGGSGSLADLWAYESVSNRWAYIVGASDAVEASSRGSYGTIGIFSATSHPGSRRFSTGWAATDCELIHLLGGWGYDSSSTEGWLNDFWTFNASVNQWAWASGDSVKNQYGKYAEDTWFSTSCKPGARYGGTAIENHSLGVVFVFGGYGYAASGSGSRLNDLWATKGPTVFVGASPTPTATSTPTPTPTPTPNLYPISWRWLSGSSTAGTSDYCAAQGQFGDTYTPAARRASGMAASSGSNALYLFGGFKCANNSCGHARDMWVYRQMEWSSVGQWAWLSGATESIRLPGQYSGVTPYPGGRDRTLIWTLDDESVYLFAGYGYASTATEGDLGDCWKFDSIRYSWRFLKGSSTVNSAASFGTKGTSAPENVPGSTKFHGKLSNGLVFGGMGRDSAASGYLSDVWRYNNVSNEWTWLNGPGAVNRNSVGGSSGSFSSAFFPGGRQAFASMVLNRYVYVFGGDGYSSSAQGFLADLWVFDTYSNQWGYISGESSSVSSDAISSYGLIGTFSGANHPGNRWMTSGWNDPNSDLVNIFGGQSRFLSVTCAVKSYSTNEDMPLHGTLAGLAPSSCLFYSSKTPTKGTVVISPDGKFSYTPSKDYYGTDSFIYRAATLSSTCTATISISVNPVNDPPIAYPYNFTTKEDSSFSGKLSGYDPEGQPVSFYVYINPVHGALSPFTASNGAFTYTPLPNWFGDDSFTFKVKDASGVYSNAALVSIIVTSVNDQPIATSYSGSTNEDTPLSGQLQAHDVEGSVEFYVVTDPQHGSVSLTTSGAFTYTPAANFYGTDYFTFRVKDEAGVYSNSAAATITVNAINDPPVAYPYNATIHKNTQLNGQLQGYDVEQSTLSFYLVSSAQNGVDNVKTSGDFTYTPNANYVGQDSFTFRVKDTSGMYSNTAEAKIHVIDSINSNSIEIEERSLRTSTVEGSMRDFWAFNVTSKEWAWAGGDSKINQLGALLDEHWFSTLNEPGSRNAFSTAVRNDIGLCYLFGGSGFTLGNSGNINDFWSTKGPAILIGASPTPSPTPTPTPTPLFPVSWRWLTGSSAVNQNSLCGTAGQYSSSYCPGSRMATTMTEASTASGNVAYVFGGSGFHSVASSAYVGDLWGYRQTGWSGIGEWAWVGGKSNEGDYNGVYSGTKYPGARHSLTSWYVQGPPNRVFIFGGVGYASTGTGDLNEVWSFDVSSGTWDFVKGSSLSDSQATSGVMGTPAAANTPGGLHAQSILSSKSDGTESLIFGGYGYFPPSFGNLADVWRYNSVTNEWTWMNGPNAVNTNSIAGTSGVYSSSYRPSGRQASAAMDTTHRPGSSIIYVFGGYGRPSVGTMTGRLADLWVYDKAVSQWTYIAGDSVIRNAKGSYGSLEFFSVSNHPGSREKVGGWSDPNSDHLVNIFGGYGYVESSLGYLNDFWSFNTSLNLWSWAGGDSVINQASAFAGPVGSWFSTSNKVGKRSSHSTSVNHDLGLMYLFGGTPANNELWTTKGPTTVMPRFPPLSIISITPSCGPITGSTQLIVYGSFYTMNRTLTISFNGTDVPAFKLNNTHIQCTTTASTFVVSAKYLIKIFDLSWRWFEAYSDPTLQYVYPTCGPSTGGTFATVVGVGFPDTGNLFAVLFGPTRVPVTRINSTHIRFITMALPQGQTSIQIAPNGQQVVPNQSLDFVMYNPPHVTNLIPRRGQTTGEAYNITVEGSGFLNTGVVRCRFGSSVFTRGVFISASILKCVSPQMPKAEIVPLEISLNGQQYTSDSHKFTFVEFFSELCRSTDELSIFVADRKEEGLRYFGNLAHSANVTVFAAPQSGEYDASQLIDGDRCCKYSAETLGYKCGVIFKQLNTTAAAIVDLHEVAFVNELLSSWYQPCKNLPSPGYEISYRNSSTDSWKPLRNRITWKKNPCRTIPGDAGATGLCADFVQPAIEARQIKWSFENEDDNFLVGSQTDGGWLYELEVHGILLSSPYKIECPAPITVRSSLNATLPPFQVTLLNIKDEALLNTAPTSIQLSIDRQLKNDFSFIVSGKTFLNDLYLLAPKVGKYRVDVMSPDGVLGCNTNVTVVEGVPYALSSSPQSGSTVRVQSSVKTDIGPLRLSLVDECGNDCHSSHHNLHRSVTLRCLNSSGILQGVLSVNLSSGYAIFSDVYLYKPRVGRYVLVGESPGLRSCNLEIFVQNGAAFQLRYDSSSSSTVPSAKEAKLNTISIHVLDGGGNYLIEDMNREIEAVLMNDTVKWNGTRVITSVNGAADFEGLVLYSPPAGTYVIQFMSEYLVPCDFRAVVTIGEATDLSVRKHGNERLFGDCAILVPPIEIVATDAGGDFVGTAMYTVSVVPQQYVGGDFSATMVDGVATFNGITLINATAGDYCLKFDSSGGQKQTTWCFSVVAGAARRIKSLVGHKITVEVKENTPIPQIKLEAVDCTGNGIEDDVDRHVSVSLSPKPTILSGTTAVLMRHGQCVFSDLMLRSPTKLVNSTYVLNVAATNLTGLAIEIDLTPGNPHMLTLVNNIFKSDNKKPLDSVRVKIFDAGGNVVKKPTSIVAQLPSGVLTRAQSTADYQWEAVWNRQITIKAARGSTVSILFYADGLPSVNVTGEVQIESCEKFRHGSVKSPSNDQICMCDKGLYLSDDQYCLKCPTGKYKDAISDDVKCDKSCIKGETSHEGATSASDCYCENGYYKDMAGRCLTCKEHATCKGGIMSPKAGYWRLDKNITRNMIPCPFNGSCLGGPNSTCKPHYNPPLCSICDPGYAKEGVKCTKCSKDALNILVLIGMGIVLFFSARSYVLRQMLGGRSPETTILKVLVSFVQVIAFVGEFRPKWGQGTDGLLESFSAVANLAIFKLQPIDCVFNRVNAYYWLLFYALLIPGSFVVPYTMYNIGRTNWYNSLIQFGRSKQKKITHRAKSRIEDYVKVVRRRSTISNKSGLDRRSDAAETKDILLWPLRLLFFYLIPAIPRSLGTLIHRCADPVSRCFRGAFRKAAGEQLEEGEVDVNSDGDEEMPRRRISSVMDPTTAFEARHRAKSVGAVLFESDPMIGRSAMSASKGAFWILFFLFLPTIVKNALEVFKCRDDLNLKGPVMSSDLTIVCNDDLHRIVTACVTWALFPIVLFLLGYVIFKNGILLKRKQLVKYLAAFNLCWTDQYGNLRIPPRFGPGIAKVLRQEKRLLRRLRKYLFLFSGYRADGVLYLWDLVIMVRKICIAAILVFARNTPMLQAVLGLILFITALILHLIFKPFDDEYARDKKMRVLPGTLELISIIATLATLLAVVLSIHDSKLAPWLDIFLMIINVSTIFLLVYLLFDALLKHAATFVGAAVSKQLRTEAAHNAACWWKKKIPIFGWGIKMTREILEETENEQKDVETLELDQPLLGSTKDFEEEMISTI